MLFLSTALFEQPTDSDRTRLCGAVVTSFDPQNLNKRPKMSMHSLEELASLNRSECAGFFVDETGVLFSDSTARRVTGAAQIAFVKPEIEQVNNMKKSLIDFVKDGLVHNVRVLQNFEKASSGEESPILIPMESFKVSNSSFNIYASYQREDKSFRTMSLVDIETNKAKDFYVAIPSDSVSSFITSYVGVVEEPAVKGLEEYTIYKVSLPLVPFPVLTGEAFCNYLAYSVAYYKIGLQIMDILLTDTKFKPDVSKVADSVYTGTPKTALPSLSIEHDYSKHCLPRVMDCLSGKGDIVELVRTDGEALITMNWIQAISGESSEGTNEDLAKYCILLRRDCKAKYLHFALELLAQRMCINQVNTFSLPFGSILKGGGVNGCSTKRTVG